MDNAIIGEVTAPWCVRYFPLLNTIVLIVFLAMSIYAFILFVKFANIGIKAFNAYLKNNKT